MSADRIELRGVRALGRHGVLEHEKREAQPFVVDVDLEVDLAPAGASDDLTDTVSYAEVAADVVAVIEGEGVDLVETLADCIAARCLARSLVEAVTVVVHKPEAPVGVPFGDVAVRVRRERHTPVVVALGGNEGDVRATLAAAVRALAAVPGVEVQAVSGLFDTDPVGGPEQPAYLNAVLLATTRLPPPALLRRLHEIEARHGRARIVRWGARTLDLDLVQVGDPADDTDVVLDDANLTLPHPRAAQRAFVLLPWLQVDPRARLRVGDEVRPVTDLVAELTHAGEAAGVRPGPEWDPAW